MPDNEPNNHSEDSSADLITGVKEEYVTYQED
jgi:hypothetical protein